MVNHPNRSRKKHIPEKLIFFRMQRDLTDKEAANLILVHPSTWFRWEAGDQRPIPLLWRVLEVIPEKTKVIPNIQIPSEPWIELRKLRNNLKMSQAAFARFLGTPLQNVKNWESPPGNVHHTKPPKMLWILLHYKI